MGSRRAEFLNPTFCNLGCFLTVSGFAQQGRSFTHQILTVHKGTIQLCANLLNESLASLNEHNKEFKLHFNRSTTMTDVVSFEG
ncbi:hypothetical protein CR513_48696, partial [Mucuna pruriens]